MLRAMKTGHLDRTGPRLEGEGGLEVKVLNEPEDCHRFDELLAREHGLGARQPSGHTLRQVVVEDGRWVALLLWISGFWHLKARDRWIGWDGVTRAERLKLIVHNARFLVLEEARREHLAGKALAAGLRALPRQWQGHFGYKPLLAETFTDPEQHAGTVYKATGWTPVGHSSGRQAEHLCDGYPHAKRPKRLWVKELQAQARDRLCASELPPEHRAGINEAPTTRCPVKNRLCQSLFELFQQVPDPRQSSGRRYPIGAVLTIIALGLLRGGGHLTTIHRTGQKLDQRQRKRLGLPFKAGTRFRAVPGYFVYRDVLARLDLEAFAGKLTDWLQAHSGQLPRTLALDGKTIRDQLGVIVSLVDTQEGTPVALEPAPEGEGYELKSAQKLLARPEVNLNEATVTGDSLHCQIETAHTIVLEKGGDYLFQVRDNQPTVHACARSKMQTSTPLLKKSTPNTDASSCAK